MSLTRDPAARQRDRPAMTRALEHAGPNRP